MHTYIIRRLLLMFPTLIGITLVVFAVMAAAPGGISAQNLVEGQNLEPQVKKAMEQYYNRLYGLDDPAPVQYLRWLNNVSPVGFTFDAENNIEAFSFTKGSDLGTSFRYGRPVLDLIAERLPITLLLNVLSIPIIYLIAIAIGVHAATQRGKSFDVNSGISMLALWSMPTMLAGVLLIGIFASDQNWHWFPTSGLSQREALDMQFLPHWSFAGDVVMLFFAVALAVAAFIALSFYGSQCLRTTLMALLGGWLGFVMAAALPGEGALFTYIFLMALLAALCGLIAYSDYHALRTGMMGMVGLCVGIGITFTLMQGEFIAGFMLDRAWHLILPVICLSYGGFAFLAKLTRSAVLENLLSDYARTARAKGVPEQQVLWSHVFRNSLLPLITVAAGLLPSLLGGSIIVEVLFSIDGMGKLAVEAVQSRDRELVLSITLIGTLLSLAGYLFADICYAIADPRVSYE